MYKSLNNTLPIQMIPYSFFFIVIRPIQCWRGVWRSFKDWDWQINLVHKDENGDYYIDK